MAIEPIGSMTAMQVQSTIKVQPVEVKPQAEYTTVNSAISATPKIDETTAAVAKSAESNTQGDSKQNDNAQTDSESVKRAVEDMNKKMVNSEAVFGIHEGTNRVTIKIVDKQTKEVIKELPPEKTLDMIAKVWEMAGLLVDEKR